MLRKNTFKYPSDPDLLEPIIDELTATLVQGGLSEEWVAEFMLPVSEALQNAMVHGNGRDPGKKVTVELIHREKMVEVRIRDQGPGFSREDLPDPTSEENLHNTHGRGVFLMDRFCDHLEFQRQENGFLVILQRFLHLPKQESGK